MCDTHTHTQVKVAWLTRDRVCGFVTSQASAPLAVSRLDQTPNMTYQLIGFSV